MIAHQQKLPFFKRIVMNIRIWKLWHDLAKEGDELAMLIVKQYDFIGFLTIGLY